MSLGFFRNKTPRIHILLAGATEENIEVIVDTGFNGTITLPEADAVRIGLVNRNAVRSGTVADGSPSTYKIYTGTLVYDGVRILNAVVQVQPNCKRLLGMSMLEQLKLNVFVDIVDDKVKLHTTGERASRSTHAFQLEESTGKRPFFYNPHNFWAYIPELKDSEDVYYAQFADEKKNAYFVVGGTAAADKEFKRGYQNDHFQIDTRTIPSLGRRDHITVLGDFVITARLSNALAARLDELYETGKSLEEILPDILKSYYKDTTVRLVFEHNAAKATKLRKLLSPNFVFE